MLTVQRLQLGTHALVVVLRDRVGDDDLVNGRGVDARNGVATQDAVSEQGVDGGGPLLLKELRGAGDGVARVDEVIDEDAYPVLDVADEHHARVALLGVLGGAAFLEATEAASA